MTSTDTDTSGTEASQTLTFLTTSGIKARMRASGQIASRIEETFVTAEQLVAAVDGDDDLEAIDGIGPKTADVIRDWYAHRRERERNASVATVERTSSRSLTIKNNGCWQDALGIELEDGDA